MLCVFHSFILERESKKTGGAAKTDFLWENRLTLWIAFQCRPVPLQCRGNEWSAESGRYCHPKPHSSHGCVEWHVPDLSVIPNVCPLRYDFIVMSDHGVAISHRQHCVNVVSEVRRYTHILTSRVFIFFFYINVHISVLNMHASRGISQHCSFIRPLVSPVIPCFNRCKSFPPRTHAD